MATFAPNVPEADPNRAPDFMNFSRTVSPFELRASADRSTGIALAGVGKALDEGVEAYGKVKEQSIKDEAYQKLTPLNDKLTENLEYGLGGDTPSSKQFTPDTPSILGKDSTTPDNAPASVQSGLDRVNRLQNLLKLKPELQTYYSGQVSAIQKEMRSENPGFRPFIDQEVSRITGGVNANEHLKNLMNLAGQVDAKKQTFNDKVVGESMSLIAKGHPELLPYVKRFQEGSIDVYNLANEMGHVQAQHATDEATLQHLNVEAQTGKNVNNLTRMYMTRRSQNTFNGMLSSVYDAGGMNMKEHLDAQAAGTEKPDAEQNTKFATLLTAQLPGLKQKLRAEFNQPSDPNNPRSLTPSQMINNPEEVEKIIDESTKDLTDKIDMIGKGQYALVHSMENETKAMRERDTFDLFNNRVLGPQIRIIRSITQELGPNSKPFLDWATTNLMNTKNGDVYGNFYNTESLAMLSRGQTLAGALGDAAKAGPPDPTTKKPTGIGPKTSNDIINLMDYITKPGNDPEMKHRFASAAFGPGNDGLWNVLATSGDRVSVFNKLADPKMVDEVDKLKDPTLSAAQRNVLEKGAAAIFKEQFANLGELAQRTPGYRVVWHPENTTHPLTVEAIDQTSTNPNEPYYGKSKIGEQTYMKQSEAQINGVLSRLGYMEKARGGDMSSYMLDYLHTMGVNPSNQDTFESKLMRAVMSGRKPPEMKANFTEEGTKGNEASNAINKALDKGASSQNLNPQFKSNISRAINDYQEQTGNKAHISSLFRTREQQAKAYANYQDGGGLAAPPGHSRHEIGEAADLNSDPKFLRWMNNNADKYGLEFLQGDLRRRDPAHIQLKRNQEASQ